MDKLVAMNVFRAVVDSGSFSKAADKLGISTTSVSRHVGDLEGMLAVSLLHRSTRRISLTTQGQIYYERCCQHLDDISETELDVSKQRVQVKGFLRLSIPHSFGEKTLMPYFPEFVDRYPELRLELSFSDQLVDLAEDGVDIAIRIASEVSQMYVAKPLMPIDLAVCASPAYLRQHGTPLHHDELSKHQCIAYTNLSCKNIWLFKKNGEEFRVPVNGPISSNNGEMNRLAALAGQGIIREPCFIVQQDLQEGRLVRLLSDYEAIPLHVFAVFLSVGRYSAKIRAVIEFLQEVLNRRRQQCPEATLGVASA